MLSCRRGALLPHESRSETKPRRVWCGWSLGYLRRPMRLQWDRKWAKTVVAAERKDRFFVGTNKEIRTRTAKAAGVRRWAWPGVLDPYPI